MKKKQVYFILFSKIKLIIIVKFIKLSLLHLKKRLDQKKKIKKNK